MRRAASAASILCSCAVACSDDGVSVYVDLKTDLVPFVELVSVRTTMEDPSRSATVGAEPSHDFILGERVAELGDVPLGTRRIRVEVLDSADRVLAARALRLDVTASIGLVVLLTRDCRGVSCTGATTCVGGVCVSDSCHEELRPEACGLRECAISDDCDVPAASCATPRCETGSCLYVETAGACAEGEYCDVDLGCQAKPPPPFDGGVVVDGGVVEDGGGGLPDAGPDAGPPSAFGTRVTGAAFHTCTTRADGHASCWGIGTGGALGDGSSSGIFSSGRRVSTLTDVVSMSAGAYHTCAVLASGAASCWGRNGSGQLGNGETMDATTPVAVSGLANVEAIDASLNFTCAVSGGSAFCWGINDMGQLGDMTTMSRSIPTPVLGIDEARGVALSQLGACVRHASGVTCFGFGYFGNGMQTADPLLRASPPLPSTLRDFVAGNDHFCALLDSGEVRCWGQNGSGQVGAGPGLSSSPQVVGVPPAAQIWAGEASTCARTIAGQMYCWGHNNEGQLGDGATSDIPAPMHIPVFDAAETFALGAGHTCLTSGDTVSCIGWNESGQLGDGTTMSRRMLVMTLLD